MGGMRVVGRLLAVLGLGAATLLVVASPAYADSSCASGRVCMWEDASFGGDKYVNQAVSANNESYDIHWWNGDNEISSIKNTSGKYVCVYAGDYTWGGDYIVIEPHSESGNLGRDHGFDNDAESFKVTDSVYFNCN
jgi:hypothetical protein